MVIRYATQDILAAFTAGDISGVFRAEDWREDETAREGHAFLELEELSREAEEEILADPQAYAVRLEGDTPGLYERGEPRESEREREEEVSNG